MSNGKCLKCGEDYGLCECRHQGNDDDAMDYIPTSQDDNADLHTKLAEAEGRLVVADATTKQLWAERDALIAECDAAVARAEAAERWTKRWKALCRVEWAHRGLVAEACEQRDAAVASAEAAERLLQRALQTPEGTVQDVIAMANRLVGQDEMVNRLLAHVIAQGKRAEDAEAQRDAAVEALRGADWIIKKLAPHELLAITIRRYRPVTTDIVQGAKYRAMIDAALAAVPKAGRELAALRREHEAAEVMLSEVVYSEPSGWVISMTLDGDTFRTWHSAWRAARDAASEAGEAT